MPKLDWKDAKDRLPELMGEAENGKDVVIDRGDGASFRLVPVVSSERRHRTFGSARGLIEMADDFDDPLDDFLPYT